MGVVVPVHPLGERLLLDLLPLAVHKSFLAVARLAGLDNSFDVSHCTVVWRWFELSGMKDCASKGRGEGMKIIIMIDYLLELKKIR